MHNVNCKYFRSPNTCMYGHASRRFYKEYSCTLLDGPTPTDGCVIQEPSMSGPPNIRVSLFDVRRR